MKILVLTTNTGGGHNSAARAIQEEAHSRGFTCHIKNFLEFTPRFKEKVVINGHYFTYRYTPKTYGIGYHLLDRDKKGGNRLYRDYAKYASKLKDYIIENVYDTVIAVHIFAGIMLTQVRKEYHLNICQYLVITDYTCSPGAANCDMDFFFIPKGIKEEFIKKGIQENRLIESGIPCRRIVYNRIEKKRAKMQLGLDDEAPLIFLCAGNVMSGKVKRITKKILKRIDYCHLAILCGKNYSILQNEDIFSKKCVHLLKKTDKMHIWMFGADCFVSKAGGLTITEAASERTPLILMNAVPGPETLNRKYFEKHQLALTADDSDDLIEKITLLLGDSEVQDEIRKNQIDLFSDISVEMVMNKIIETVQEKENQ